MTGVFNPSPLAKMHVHLCQSTAAHPMATAQELANDPLGILRPPAKLQHALPLASAYAAAADSRDADGRRRMRLDPKHHEPKVSSLSCVCL